MKWLGKAQGKYSKCDTCAYILVQRLYTPLECLTISDNIIKRHLNGLVLDEVAQE